PPLPGVHPFTRGRTAHRDTTVGWGVRTRHGRGLGPGADAEAVNTAVLHDLENGSTSLWFALGGQDLPHAALERALDGVFLDLAPVVLDAGAEMTAAAEAFLAVLEHTDADLTEVHAHLGADPLTVLVRGGADLLDEAVALAVRAHEHTAPLTSITVDGTVFHDAGAGDAQELGAALAAGVEYLRALTGGGLDVDDALGQLEFRVAATDEQFATTAKLRAGRSLWARVAQVVGGAPASGAAPQHAVTSAAMMSQRDPWVNMLRTTLAAFGAGVGGADAVTVLPFDAVVPGGAPDVSDAFAARIARNTQLLLLEESHLGRVIDPAGGSWYVENLTDAMAQRAWTFFQEIEAAGGFRAALSGGLLAERIGLTRAQRDDDVAHRRKALTGVNEFPNLDEAPIPATTAPEGAGALPAVRYAAQFEQLRNRSDAHLAAAGTRPRVLLATLGPIAEHNVRAGFITNLLAAGGIVAINPGPLDSPEAISSAVTAADSPVAIVCGTDKRYASAGSDAVQALRDAGAAEVFVAGARKAFAEREHQPDGFLGAGVNAVAALTGLLETLGVK
ncbi:MAG: methylmalonyl-CoA mutase family protein, partial [Actinomycetota bacterium]|nr:methylmalonyl-CoA mutase family protein [Actinomycetota bacterium]